MHTFIAIGVLDTFEEALEFIGLHAGLDRVKWICRKGGEKGRRASR